MARQQTAHGGPKQQTVANGQAGQRQLIDWPVCEQRRRPRWFPSRHRLIGLVRASSDSFVLPPAIVRKAAWRE